MILKNEIFDDRLIYKYMTKQVKRWLLVGFILVLILLTGYFITKNKISEQSLQKGIQSIEQKDYATAIRNLKKAIWWNKKSAPAWLNLGKALYYTDDLSSALDNLDLSLSKDSFLAETYYFKGLVSMKTKDYAGSLKNLSR